MIAYVSACIVYFFGIAGYLLLTPDRSNGKVVDAILNIALGVAGAIVLWWTA